MLSWLSGLSSVPIQNAFLWFHKKSGVAGGVLCWIVCFFSTATLLDWTALTLVTCDRAQFFFLSFLSFFVGASSINSLQQEFIWGVSLQEVRSLLILSFWRPVRTVCINKLWTRTGSYLRLDSASWETKNIFCLRSTYQKVLSGLSTALNLRSELFV